MRASFLVPLAASFLVLLGLCPEVRAVTVPADTAYWRWASEKFRLAVAADPTQAATNWGDEAIPDRDGLPNRPEYSADTDHTRATPTSDCCTHRLTTAAPVWNSRHSAVNASLAS